MREDAGDGHRVVAAVLLVSLLDAQHALDAQRVAQLDKKEDQLKQMENEGMKSMVNGVIDAEYKRNRTRVIEIWNLCQVVNKNELRSDRFDD